MNDDALDNYTLDGIVDDGGHLDWSWTMTSDIYDTLLEDENNERSCLD